MKQPWRTLGWIWAAPVTLCGFIYVTVFSVFGWYKPEGMFGDALVWSFVEGRSPAWLGRAWHHWSGHAIGNVVVVNANLDTHRGRVVLRHEQEHVRQCMALGAFMPLLYSLAWLTLRCCKNAHPYYDNPLEIDARRAAGQVVDIIGALRRAALEGKIKLPTKPHK